LSNTTSQHILGTAANLLGFCLFVLTALNIADREETKIIDAWTSIIAVMLTFSCIFSFISIRTNDERRERLLERIADNLFLASLIGILGVIVLIAYHFVQD